MGKSYRLRKVDPASKRPRKGTLRRHCLPTTPIEPLEPRRLLSTSLLTDINPGPPRTIPSALTDVNGTLFFITEDGVQGPKLWKSDGTTAGTKPITTLGSAPSKHPFSLTNVNGTVFFANDNIDKGRELWKSDGTAPGTILIKDINPTGDSSPANLTNLNGTLIFAANDGLHGVELWRSDGTPDGTILLKDINPNGSSQPVPLAVVNGILYFAAYEPQTGTELWKTDGTAAGTVLVKDICPGPDSSIRDTTGGIAAAVDGILYFAAYEPRTGTELWMSNGTVLGTNLVEDTNKGKESSRPSHLTNCNGKLFFSTHEYATLDTPRVLRNYVALPLLSWQQLQAYPSVANFTATKAGVLFTTQYWDTKTSAWVMRLWAVDQTQTNSSVFLQEHRTTTPVLVNVDGTAFFTSRASNGTADVWMSDGTPTGTHLAYDIYWGQDPCVSGSLTAVGDKLFFATSSSLAGLELWAAKPRSYCRSVAQLGNVAVSDSNPDYFTDVNGTVFFQATDPAHGTELWKTDGTATGTILVKDIVPGPGSSFPLAAPQYRAPLNGKLFFTVDDGIHGKELWVSDGTAAGTTMVKDIFPGATGSEPTNLNAVGSTLFFVADDGVHGRELWKTDGTAAGTVMIEDLNPGENPSFYTGYGSDEHRLATVNGTLFFMDYDGHLYRITPTDAKATYVGYVESLDAFTSDKPTQLVVANGTLFAVAEGAFLGGIIVSDGSLEGTVQLARTRQYNSFLGTINGDSLFYLNGRDLWKTDGTVQGTTLVKSNLFGDISIRRNLNPFTLNGLVFLMPGFGTSDKSISLWKTDGTAKGTVPTTWIPNPSACAVLGDALYFTARMEDGSTQLWRTDGTAPGTFALRVLHTPSPAAPSFTPSLTVIGNTLYFSAYDPIHGIEPWTLTLSSTPPIALAGGPYTTCKGGIITLDASGSRNPDPTETLIYEWDLDGDGAFGETGPGHIDETDPQPSVSPSSPSRTIPLRVRNSAGQYTLSTATLNQLRLTGSPTGNAFTLRVNAATDAVEVLQDTSGQMQLIYSIPRASFTYLSIESGTTTLTLDYSNGDPLASATLSVEGASATKVRLQTLNGPPVVRVPGLFISAYAALDLADTTLVVQPTPARRNAVLTELSRYIRTARTSTTGPWQGSGLTSSLAQADSHKGLALIPNDPGTGSLLDPTLPPTALLVRCTWNGDINLDGTIDAADYFRIDSGFITQQTGYHNGDLNFDGKVDAADYFLIDSAFIAQSAPLAASSLRPISTIAYQFLPFSGEQITATNIASHSGLSARPSWLSQGRRLFDNPRSPAAKFFAPKDVFSASPLTPWLS